MNSIPNNISRRVVVVGVSPTGKGGIASVVAQHGRIMDTFNFVEVQRQDSNKAISIIRGIGKSFKYLSPSYKVAHIHAASYNDFYRSAIFIALMKLMGKRVIMHMHGAKFAEFLKAKPKLVKSVCKMTDAIATVSTPFVKFMLDNGLTQNAFYIPNSIRETKDSTKSADKGSHSTIVFSYFGALDSRKGIFETVEAVGRNKDFFRGKMRLIIGGNGDEQRLKDLIAQYAISDIVDYRGWLDAEAKNRLLLDSDVFVHPSLFESFGISILEAMDYGLPIITTAVGGIPDLVTNDVNGLIVEPGNVDQIAQAMKRLVENPQLRQRLGEQSAIHARDFYEPRMVEKIQQMYVEMLK